MKSPGRLGRSDPHLGPTRLLCRYDCNYNPRRETRGRPSVGAACRQELCGAEPGARRRADIFSVTAGQSDVSLALDVSLFAFASIVGAVSCFTRRGAAGRTVGKGSRGCWCSFRGSRCCPRSFSLSHTHPDTHKYMLMSACVYSSVCLFDRSLLSARKQPG